MLAAKSVLKQKQTNNNKTDNQLVGIVKVPQVYLHGFAPPDYTPTEFRLKNGKKLPEQERIDEEIKRFESDDNTQAMEKANKDRQKTEGDNEVVVTDKRNKTDMSTYRYEELLGSDLSQDINISKFVTSCDWANSTTPPYGNANIQLIMPPELCHFLLHGEQVRFKSQEKGSVNTRVNDFKYIQAGGWISILMPHNDNTADPKRYSDRGSAVFFGKITTINVTTTRGATGTMVSSLSISCATWLYPYMKSEHRKSALINGEIAKVDSAAISAWNDNPDDNNDGLFQKVLSSVAKQEPPIKTLRTMMRGLGHFALPDTLFPRRDGSLSRSGHIRLGQVIKYIGDWSIYADDNGQYKTVADEALVGTPYENSTGAGDIILDPLVPVAEVQSIMQVTTTMWSLIENIFLPNSEIIELFPVLIPNKKDKKNDEKGLPNLPSDLLGASLYMVYRLKPLPPDFDITTQNLDDNYKARLGGIAAEVKSDSTNYEKYFLTKKDVSEEGFSSKYVEIDSKYVISETLTWDDANRINAVHFTLPYANRELGDLNLFGISGSGVVLNPNDINTHGLRAYTNAVPFFAPTDGKKERNLTAGGALAERFYFREAEGHAYATGTILCQYIPIPDLVHGVWCKIVSGQSLEDENGAGTGRGTIHGLKTDLVFYLEAVNHSFSIDGNGKPTASTVLSISRASYGGRIPVVKVGKTTTTGDLPAKKNTTKQPARAKVKKRTQNRKANK